MTDTERRRKSAAYLRQWRHNTGKTKRSADAKQIVGKAKVSSTDRRVPCYWEPWR